MFPAERLPNFGLLTVCFLKLYKGLIFFYLPDLISFMSSVITVTGSYIRS